MLKKIKSKSAGKSCNVDACFSVFFNHIDSIAILLDHDFKIVNLNASAKKHYKICSTNVLGKDFDFLEKNSEFTRLLDEIKQKPASTAKIITYPDENKNDGVPISWSFLNLQHLHSESSYLVLGNILLSEQYTKIQNERIERYLKEITNCMPGNFYWKDKNGCYLGCNQTTLIIPGYKREQELIGKTDYDIWPEQAEELRKNDAAVMASGKPAYFEETVQLKGQNPKYYAVVKIPLRDANGSIVGIIGNSLDITYRKEAEGLKLENELQKTKLQEQEIFRKIANQVAHDIRSPLTSLSIIVESCKNIPEAERITLRKIAAGIGDIANHLLNKYKSDAFGKEGESAKPMLVSLSLSEVVSEKKYQYKHSPVKFNYLPKPGDNFVFIKVEPGSFTRMISNLINNSVDSFDGRDGRVDLTLKSTSKFVMIIIQDNGKGMPQKIIDKIMNNIAVTSGKKGGAGIGFTQVCDTLQRNQGKLEIESKVDWGTKIILTFPKVESPEWIADKIKLKKGDTVIVLDDDDSIHFAWDARFKPFKSDVELRHFKSGEETIDFINSLAVKDKIFLLADFELISQTLNGLQVIERTSMQHSSTLVTSHYANPVVHDLAIKAKVKILPKQLVSDVSVKIEANRESINRSFIKTKLVIVDDDELLVDSLASFFRHKNIMVDVYHNPKIFLEHLSEYAKNTKICLDNEFHGKQEGVELAKQLNKAGYTQLYMLSGKDFKAGEIPNYLTVITKGDIDGLDKLLKNK
ncbi:MAG: PAS domain-containing protein [Gammaproteobacteria bacterium]|nr:PAS domain-containing protein [Gammaproteobacteria bacterium]